MRRLFQFVLEDDGAVCNDSNVYNEGRRSFVAQLTVRGVPDDLVKALRIRAARHGRSAESEHRLLLAEVLQAEPSDFWARADALRGQTRPQRSDSATLQRQQRDER